MGLHDCLSKLLHWANLIPTGLYALVAAVVALVGIWLQMRAHAHRERIDRETDMRREVYLAACEAAAKGMDFLAKFADPGIPDVEHRLLIKDYASHVAKVGLVGDLKTVTTLQAYNQKFLEAITKLLADRIQLMRIKRQIDFANENLIEYRNLQKERVKGGTLVAPYTNEEFNKTWAAVDQMIGQQEIALARQSFAIIRKVVPLQKELAVFSTEAIIAAREDLGFNKDINDAEFRKQMVDAGTRAQDTLLAYVNSLESQMAGTKS